MPSRDLNSGLPYSKPTRYCLRHAFLFQSAEPFFSVNFCSLGLNISKHFLYLKQSTKADVNLHFFLNRVRTISTEEKNCRKNEARSCRLHRLAITLIGPITLTFSAGREGLSSFTSGFKETVSSDLKQKSL